MRLFSARDLGADLTVGGEAVRGAERIVEGEVELKLPRRVLVVALDHVEPHRARVLDDPQVHGPQTLELVDVVAVRIREAAVRLPVRAALEPHHLRLGPVAEVQPVVVGLELLVDAAEVTAAVRGEERTGCLALLAVAEQGAPQARHPLVPRKLAEGLRLRDADQLLLVRTVAEVFAVAVEEEVDRRPVDELEAPRGNALPVVGGDALAADAAGDRHELKVQVLDPEPVDHLANLPNLAGSPGRFHEAFDVHRHSSGLLQVSQVVAVAANTAGAAAVPAAERHCPARRCSRPERARGSISPPGGRPPATGSPIRSGRPSGHRLRSSPEQNQNATKISLLVSERRRDWYGSGWNGSCG